MWPGYTLSAASYVCSLLDPWLVDELDLREHGLSYYRKDPYAFTPLHDGRSLLLGTDAPTNAREIAAFDPRDVAGFEAYVERTDRSARALFDSFSDDEPRFDRFDARYAGAAARLGRRSSVERYVSTPVLQAELVNDGLIGTNLGPRDAGTGYVLAHHLAGRVLGVQGAWAFVRGGMGCGLACACIGGARYGAEIFSDRDVSERVVDGDGAACGVEVDGRVVRARGRSRRTRIRARRSSICSSAGRSTRRSSRRVRIVEDDRPVAEAEPRTGRTAEFTAVPGSNRSRTIARRSTSRRRSTICRRRMRTRRNGGESEEPLIECFLQTPTDPSLAPPGKHILSIFAQYFPYDRADGWSERETRSGRRQDRRDPRALAPNLPNAIEHRQVAGRAGSRGRASDLTGGHIFHGELLPGQIYENRFATRTPVREPLSLRIGRASGRLRQRLSGQARGARDGAGRSRCCCIECVGTLIWSARRRNASSRTCHHVTSISNQRSPCRAENGKAW